MTRQTVHFSGRVQGVGFRYTTCRIARRHPVAGYVMNLPDGRVQCVAEGQPDAIKAFIQDIRDTMAPYITTCDIQPAPAPAPGSSPPGSAPGSPPASPPDTFGAPGTPGSFTVRY